MTCPVCFLHAFLGVSLSNGEVVHPQCFENLKNSVVSADQTAFDEHARVSNLQSQLANQNTFLGKIVRFLGRSVDSEVLKSNISEAKSRILVAEAASLAAKLRATPIYDLMLDYPPDWPERSAAVVTRDKVCTKCRSTKILQAHHIVPLSKGGTNRLHNLKLLCKSCHQNVHGGKEFTITRASEPPAFSDRVQLLKAAIATGANVEFMYRKPTDKSQKMRRVTPYALVEIDHDYDGGKTLCLSGYCHLRKTKRNFALKRMTGVKYAKG